MLMHPLWQIKQVVNIDCQWSIDHCNNFGGHTSPKLWWSFILVVLWISAFKQDLHALKCYVDDHFSFWVAEDLKLYNKYNIFLPSSQVALLQLQLQDEINLPHEEAKQISRSCIPIIGFKVDHSMMMFVCPKWSKLMCALLSPCEVLARLLGSSRSLKVGLTRC